MKIEGKEYRTIWFENNVVRIIDQTKLPHQFKIKDLKTVKDAINAITELQNQKQIEPKPFVFKLSEILRLYVERLFNFPALELTGEEFMREIVSHSFFKNRYENTLRDFVVQGDIIKYSRELVSERTTDQLLELALHFVKDTHARLVEEKINGEEPSKLKIGNK